MAEETKSKSLYEKLFAAMSEMSSPIKDTSAYKYKYAQLDQVLRIVKTALENNGLLLSQTTFIRLGDYEHWILSTGVTDPDTGELVTLDQRLLTTDKDAQIQGSYETYMRRYALLTAFGLAAEDDDGEQTKQAKQTKVKPNKVAQKAAKADPTNGVAKPTLYALGKTCEQYAQMFGIDPKAHKASVWQELKGKDEPAYLNKISEMRKAITQAVQEQDAERSVDSD